MNDIEIRSDGDKVTIKLDYLVADELLEFLLIAKQKGELGENLRPLTNTLNQLFIEDRSEEN
jgi:hypothetical protein